MKKWMALAIYGICLFFLTVTNGFAQEAGKVDAGDTAFVLLSAALVMLMTPGLALFYGGMVRRKNVLGTIMQSFVAIAIVSVQWILFGYSLSFGPDIGGIIGGLDWAGLRGVGGVPNPDYAATIPHIAFMIYQAMFAVITPALITGAFAERMKFSAFFVFTILWSTIVYDPVAHWIWGTGGWLKNMGVLDFAGPYQAVDVRGLDSQKDAGKARPNHQIQQFRVLGQVHRGLGQKLIGFAPGL